MDKLDFTPRPIDLADIDRVVDIEQQELHRMGFDDEQAALRSPDIAGLEHEITAHPDNYLGVYVADKLIGFGVFGDWTPEDDMPFARNALDRGLIRLSDSLTRRNRKYDLGIFRIGIDNQQLDAYRFRATYSILQSVVKLADYSGRPIYTAIYDPPANPIVDPLLSWGFEDSGRHIGPADKHVHTAKYVRKPITNGSKGEPVGRSVYIPRPATETNF